MSSFREKIDKVFANIDALKEVSDRITGGFISRVEHLDMKLIGKVYYFKKHIVTVSKNLDVIKSISTFADKFDFTAFDKAYSKLKHMPDDIGALVVIVPQVKEVYLHLPVIRESLAYLKSNANNLAIFKKAAESKSEATKLAKLIVTLDERQKAINALLLTSERQVNALNYVNERLKQAEEVEATAKATLKTLSELTVQTSVMDIDQSGASYDKLLNKLTVTFAKPLSVKGDKGDDGKGLLINKIGTLQDRNLYNKADIGFIYLAADAKPKPTFYIKAGISYDQWEILEVPHA